MKSELVKSEKINGKILTLVRLERMAPLGCEYSTYEVGVRDEKNLDHFELIQFEMNKDRAWEIIKNRISKGKTVWKINELLEYLWSRRWNT